MIADRAAAPIIIGRKGAAQVYGIDLLRFVAALIVCVYHLAFTAWATPHPYVPTASLAPLVPLGRFTSTGWVGVEIFFVISGYVIAYTANGRAPIGFINSCILRLVPGVLACATLTIPALLYFGQPVGHILHSYLGSILFFPYPPWVAGPYWTLTVEIVFYALIFALLWLDRFDRLEAAMLLLGAASATLWLAVAIGPQHGAAGRAIDWIAGHRPGQLVLLHHGVFFAIGALAWLVMFSGWTVRRGIALAVFAVAGLGEIAHQAAATAVYMNQPVSAQLACALWAGGMLLFGGSIAYNGAIAKRLHRLQHALRTMGLSTYPLYLIHEPTGIALMAIGAARGVPPLPLVIVVMLVLVIVAIGIALFIEPVLRGIGHVALLAIERRLPARLVRLREPTKPLGAAS